MSTATLVSASGWQSGISSCVRFAAMMPATRAAPSTSPFLALPVSDQRQRFLAHHHRAFGDGDASVAACRRHVDHAAPRPCASRWVRALRLAIVMLSPPCARRAPSSARVAAATSACRIRLSPTRKADMPTRQPREIGRREDAALADQRCGPSGSAARALRWSRAWSRRSRRLRLLMPISGERKRSARSSSALVMDLDQHVHAEREGRVLEVLRRVIVDRGHDDQDAVGAPGARLGDLIGSNMKSLRSAGSDGRRARGDQKIRAP